MVYFRDLEFFIHEDVLICLLFTLTGFAVSDHIWFPFPFVFAVANFKDVWTS